MKISLFAYCTKKSRGNSTHKEKKEKLYCQEQSLTELWRWGVWTWYRSSKASKWLYKFILDELSMKKHTFNLWNTLQPRIGLWEKTAANEQVAAYFFLWNSIKVVTLFEHIWFSPGSGAKAKTISGLKLKLFCQLNWKKQSNHTQPSYVNCI